MSLDRCRFYAHVESSTRHSSPPGSNAISFPFRPSACSDQSTGRVDYNSLGRQSRVTDSASNSVRIHAAALTEGEGDEKSDFSEIHKKLESSCGIGAAEIVKTWEVSSVESVAEFLDV